MYEVIEIMNVLQYVLTTLNMIKVSGKDDLQRLLGCILALETLLKENDKEEKKEVENDG